MSQEDLDTYGGAINQLMVQLTEEEAAILDRLLLADLDDEVKVACAEGLLLRAGARLRYERQAKRKAGVDA